MKDIIKQIATDFNVTQKLAKEVVDATVVALATKIVKTKKLNISGFGKFVVEQKAERKGRNPKTNEPLVIPAKKF